jgi:hypothetical protein
MRYDVSRRLVGVLQGVSSFRGEGTFRKESIWVDGVNGHRSEEGQDTGQGLYHQRRRRLVPLVYSCRWQAVALVVPLRWQGKTNGPRKYPAVSLGLARERHGEGRRLLASGVDPMAQRKADKTAQQVLSKNSFASIAAMWLDHWQEGKSPRHVDSVRRRMASDILPCLGARAITEIEAPELVAMTKAIEQRGARDIAKRALETTGQVFRYAIAHGMQSETRLAKFAPATC